MRTTIGGQALLEGIIMIGPEKSAIVVRRSDGSFEIKEDAIGASNKNAFLKLPFIRGTVLLFRSMKRGISALTYSAQFFEEGESAEEPGKFEKWLEKKIGAEKIERYSMGFALVLGILIPIGLFILLPTLIAGISPSHSTQSTLTRNLLEGVIRIVIFLGILIVRFPDEGYQAHFYVSWRGT